MERSAGLVTFLFAAPWFVVIGWAYGWMPNLPVPSAIGLDLAWAIADFVVFQG